MSSYRTSDVFVPGGMPILTYVPRTDIKLEERLNSAKENLCKLVTVTGATKSGKTVLVNRIFPRNESIWVDGGIVREEEDLWQYILEEISGYTEAIDQQNIDTGTSFKGRITVGANIFKGRADLEHQRTSGRTTSKKLSLSPPSAAISQLRVARISLIIDDFHYLNREFQGNLIRALKPLIFEGLPALLYGKSLKKICHKLMKLQESYRKWQRSLQLMRHRPLSLIGRRKKNRSFILLTHFLPSI